MDRLADHHVASEDYGATSDGASVERFRLRSPRLQVDVISYGARITSVHAPDPAGELGEVTLGLADLSAYERDTDYLGASIGRYANRIAGGRFVLDGTAYEVPTNEGTNALHGGTRGFDSHVWQGEAGSGAEVRMRRTSPDGEMGFPGDLDVVVTYRIEEADLVIEYAATSTAPTVVNLTNHMYFNLAGGGSVEGHVVTLDADHILPVNDALVPTGELLPVDGTAFDLRSPVVVGYRLRDGDPQLLKTRGYDHTFVLGVDPTAGALRRAARVEDPSTGRSLELWTERPGVQFYTGNFLDGTVAGRDGRTYRQTDALCLEPQHFPDSPNHPDFPSTVLRPGETYTARDVYRFG